MSPRKAYSLRFRLNAAILAVVLVITGIFTAILLPVGRGQVENARRQGERIMATVAASNTNRLANEVFEGRLEAVRIRVQEMIEVAGLAMAGVYGPDGFLIQGAGAGVPESLSGDLIGIVGRRPHVWEHDEHGLDLLMQLTRVEAMGTEVGWLVLGHSMADARQTRTQTLMIFAGLLGSILATLLILFNFIFKRTIIRPIERLGNTMGTIAGGAMGERIEVGGDDEIGRLGTSFNTMADRIQEQRESLVRAEERYRSLFENAAEGIFQAGIDGRFLHVNPAMARILGYASPGEMENSDLDLANQTLARREDRERLLALLDEKGKAQGFEALMQRKDAGVFWGSVSLRIIVGPDGSSLRYEGSLTDITLRKEKERAEEERTAAQLASREKSAFLARMSHEIRTPLNAILGMSELLADTTLDREQRGFVDTLTMSGELLLALIDDILDFSRAESGRLALENIPFDPVDVAGDVCRLLEPRAVEKGLAMEFHAGNELPDRVLGDPTRLRQVLINLVGNAVKFTHHGQVRLEVSRAPLAGAPDRLRFQVCDTGIGIAPEQLESVFESFTQADTSTTRRYGGTGLGLAISKGLVELMGGRLDLDSEPGRGSTFTFYLNLPVASPREEAAATGAEKPGDGRLRTIMRVLLVDDLPLNRDVVRQLLKGQPILLDEAENGLQAVEMIDSTAYDLVFMDLEMPVMDGLDATRLIRAREAERQSPPLPVVALTGHALAAQRKECLAVGCTEYMAKPVRKKDLLRILSDLIPSGGSVVDWGYLLDLVGGEQEDMTAYCRAVLQRLPGEVEALNAGQESGDLEGVRRRAHSLKSTARSFGADGLAGMSQDLEDAAGGRDAEAVRGLLEDVLEGVGRMLAELERGVGLGESRG